MSPHQRYIALGNDKEDDQAKLGAMYDGAVFAEVVAEDAYECRQNMYAAIRYAAVCHVQIEC